VFSSQLSALPTQEREYIEMKRQQKIKESVYLFLMQKLQEKELVNSPDEQAGRGVDAAYSSAKPVYPRKVFVLAIALAATFILSLIIISFRVFVSTKTK
jgi:tyrosine-protein kinase Etk/Wzc